MTTAIGARTAWHPLTGALAVASLAVVAVLWTLVGAGPAVASLIGFLAMGAVAGFSVSGST